MTSKGISRRQTLTGAAAVVGVGVPFLASCSGDDGESATDTAPTTDPGEKLGPSGDVPVGGGTIYADQKIVVTQPQDGEFRGFSAVCTHAGCLVANVDNGTSLFSEPET